MGGQFISVSTALLFRRAHGERTALNGHHHERHAIDGDGQRRIERSRIFQFLTIVVTASGEGGAQRQRTSGNREEGL